MSTSNSPAESVPPFPTAQFGTNEWLVEEMYQRFLDDPRSVDSAWHDFFADYRPGTDPVPTTAEPSAAEPDRPRSEPASSNGKANDPTAHLTKPPTAGAPAPGSEAKPAAGSTSRAAKPAAPAAVNGEVTPLRGAANAVVKNMQASLGIPTATSVRAVPAKLLADNRVVINNQLKRTRGGKISFTHLIGYAVVRAMADFPVMNRYLV